MIRLLTIVMLAATVMACGPRTQFVVENEPPEWGEGISGYNEPRDEDFEKGVGFRAVANGRTLCISIRNRTPETLYIEPQSFGILLPQERRAYVFDAEQGDILGAFPPEPVQPGGYELFAVGVAGIQDGLVGKTVMFQYPPLEIRTTTEIEPVGVTPGS